jgi:hypothetical protein
MIDLTPDQVFQWRGDDGPPAVKKNAGVNAPGLRFENFF